MSRRRRKTLLGSSENLIKMTPALKRKKRLIDRAIASDPEKYWKGNIWVRTAMIKKQKNKRR